MDKVDDFYDNGIEGETVVPVIEEEDPLYFIDDDEWLDLFWDAYDDAEGEGFDLDSGYE